MPDEYDELLDSVLPKPSRSAYDPIIKRHAERRGLDPELVRRVVTKESGGNQSARSWANAQGLMQLMPGTAKRYGVKNPNDPEENIRGGVDYLGDLMDEFKDPAKVLAAYNAGEGRVRTMGYERTRTLSNFPKGHPKRGGYAGSTGEYVDTILKGYQGKGAQKDEYDSLLDDVMKPAAAQRDEYDTLLDDVMAPTTVEPSVAPQKALIPRIRKQPRKSITDALGELNAEVSRFTEAAGGPPAQAQNMSAGFGEVIRRAPKMQLAELRRAEDNAQRGQPTGNPTNVDLRVMKGEQPTDRLAYMREGDLKARTAAAPSQRSSIQQQDSMQARDAGIIERIKETVGPYVPGLTSLDTPMGVKTDALRGAASLGMVDLSREVSPEEKLINPDAQARADLAYGVGSIAPGVLPYVGAAKVLGSVPALAGTSRVARGAKTAATFGGVDVVREGIHAAQTGGEISPENIAASTAIGAAMGAIPGLNPSMKQRLTAAILPQVVMDSARGVPLEQSAWNALTNLGFEFAGGARGKAKTEGRSIGTEGQAAAPEVRVAVSERQAIVPDVSTGDLGGAPRVEPAPSAQPREVIPRERASSWLDQTIAQQSAQRDLVASLEQQLAQWQRAGGAGSKSKARVGELRRQLVEARKPLMAAEAEATQRLREEQTARVESSRYSETPRFDEWVENESGQRLSQLSESEVGALSQRYKQEFASAPSPSVLREMPPLQPAPAPRVRHSDPRIDGGEVIGRTPSGKLKVRREDGGVSTVQDPRRQGNREATLMRTKSDEVPVPAPAERPVDAASTEAVPRPLSRPQTERRDTRLATPEEKTLGEGLVQQHGERRKSDRAAETDDLTGLGNQRAWNRALAKAEADPGTTILSGDINNMKAINDNLGHKAGDAAIQQAANALKQAAAEHGESRVFRSGLGDEISGIVSKEKGEAIQRRAEEIFGEQSAGKHKVSFSVGLGENFKVADADLSARKTERKGGQSYRDLSSTSAEKGGPIDAAIDKTRVADQEGKPITVYHGTSRTFDEFKKGMPPNTPGKQGEGIHFSDNPKYAEGYGERVVAAQISIRRPYYVPAGEYEHTYISPQRRAQLESQGYDGVIFKDPSGRNENEFVVFEPSQIKVINPESTQKGEPNAAIETPAAKNETSQTQAPGPLPPASVIPRIPKERATPKTLERAGLEGGTDRLYDPVTNDEALASADATIKKHGLDASVEIASKTEAGAEKTALGISLISELQKAGKHEQAVEVASDLARQLTKSGQAIQVVAVVARLSPERQVMAAQKIVEKRNPNARLKPEQAKVINEHAVRLEDAIARIAALETRIQEVKLQPKVGIRRPKLETFQDRLSKAEADARARLQARTEGVKVGGGERGASPIPLDIADYAIIGAAKLARKGATFAAWSADMASEFGAAVKPKLKQIYRESYRYLQTERKTARQESEERLARQRLEGPVRREDLSQLVEDRRQAQRDARNARYSLARTFNFLERGRGGQVYDTVVDVANLPRTLMSSVDLSAPLRQGGFFTVTEPKASAKAAKDMIRSISEKGYDKVLDEIANHPDHKLAKRMGVEFTEVGRDDFTLSHTEEAYLSKIAGALPVVKQSQQAYVAFLDGQRQQVFSKFAGELRAQGKTPETHPEAFRYIAKFVNIGTGRGSLGHKGNQIAPALNTLFFSPRFLASRVQLLNMAVNPVSWARMPEGARKIVMRKNAQFTGTIATVLGLAAAAGAKVGLDPDDADFLKIRFGNWSYDALSGIQQPMRFMFRLGKAIKADVTKDDLYAGEDKADLITKFGRSKLAPGASFLTDYLAGENYSGKKFDLTEKSTDNPIVSRAVPMFLKDAYEAMQAEGLTGAAKLAPGFFGVGVQNYPVAPEKARTHAEKLTRKIIRDRMPDEARTQEEMDKSQVIGRIRLEARQGQDVRPKLKEMIKRHEITDRQAQRVLGAATQTRLQEDFKSMSLEDAERVFRAATPQERETIKAILESKRAKKQAEETGVRPPRQPRQPRQPRL